MFSIRYQLLLTRHKSLKTRGHTKSQLIDEGRLILAVDLNFDARLVRGFVCGETLNKIIYRAGDLMSTASRHNYNELYNYFIQNADTCWVTASGYKKSPLEPLKRPRLIDYKYVIFTGIQVHQFWTLTACPLQLIKLHLDIRYSFCFVFIFCAWLCWNITACHRKWTRRLTQQ